MDNYPDITSFFITIIENTRGLDMAEAEFRRQLADDHDMRTAYRDWCEENGHSQRHGFTDFAEEYLESRESVWNALNDYDEDE